MFRIRLPLVALLVALTLPRCAVEWPRSAHFSCDAAAGNDCGGGVWGGVEATGGPDVSTDSVNADAQDIQGGEVVAPDGAVADAQLSGDVSSPADVAADVAGAIDAVDATTGSCAAKVVIKEGGEVIPQTLLHLKGDQSTASPGGVIVTYKWTVTQPPGSQQVFVPSDSFPNPYFTANVAGQYDFCLEIWEAGEKSCTADCDTVLVLPEETIHVELLWKTPGDPDETDTGPNAGSDMDLHFAHPMASGSDIDCDGVGDPWFSNPFDAFWFNPNPNWNSSNPAVNDDPSLDLDDTDGAGPENLNLDQPEGTVGKPFQYAIGAHHWNSHGYGTSYATINVYIGGVLALQVVDVKMDDLDMWYLGKLNWPNGMTGGIGEPVELCYQSGDVCSGKGKMWQPPPGAWCITPCYVNDAFAVTPAGFEACSE